MYSKVVILAALTIKAQRIHSLHRCSTGHRCQKTKPCLAEMG